MSKFVLMFYSSIYGDEHSKGKYIRCSNFNCRLYSELCRIYWSGFVLLPANRYSRISFDWGYYLCSIYVGTGCKVRDSVIIIDLIKVKDIIYGCSSYLIVEVQLFYLVGIIHILDMIYISTII